MAETISEFGRAFKKFNQENGFNDVEVAQFLSISKALPGILSGEGSIPQEFYFYGRLSSIPYMGRADLYKLVQAANPPEWLEKWVLKSREGVDFAEGLTDEVLNNALVGRAEYNVEEQRERFDREREEMRSFLISIRRESCKRELRDYVVDTTLPWRDYLKEN